MLTDRLTTVVEERQSSAPWHASPRAPCVSFLPSSSGAAVSFASSVDSYRRICLIARAIGAIAQRRRYNRPSCVCALAGAARTLRQKTWQARPKVARFAPSPVAGGCPSDAAARGRPWISPQFSTQQRASTADSVFLTPRQRDARAWHTS